MKNKLLFTLIIGVMGMTLVGCGAQQSTNAVSGGNANIVDENLTDDTTAGDLNPTDDKLATSTGAQDQSTSTSQINTNSTSTMEQSTFDKTKNYTAVLHTEDGDIEIALTASATPITVNNFVTLAKKNFYDNTIFHRVLKGFMIQGGDPTGSGAGGPGYKFDDEPFTGEYTRGTVAMANAGPNTNGSQFFIMHADVPLQKDYVIFGHVTKGLDVVDKIATAQTTLGSDGAMSKPVTPVKIKSVIITEK
ncbi:MAG: peptidylprolyl isomerase [Patescibacteria group bacterium]|jgi:peptidylprolyl isomerase